MIDSISNPIADLKKARRRGDRAVTPTVDRLPPHDLQMEMGVLGCCLLDPNECIALCIEALKDDGKLAFYDLRHQTVYETLVAMFEARTPVEIMTVQQHLKDRDLLKQIGDIAYLSQLQDVVPSSANCSFYLEKLKDKFLLRRLMVTCTGIVGRIFDNEGEVEDLLDESEKEFFRIAEARVGGRSLKTNDLVHAAIGKIDMYFQRQGEISGIATGFDDLDKMTDGLHGGEMIVIAARPAMGKTSVATQIAEHVALVVKLPVGIFSLEMTAESLVLRMICSLAKVNLRNIRDGFMTETDFPKLQNAAGKINAAPLHFDDTPALSILQFRARARRMHQQHGIKLFVVDYLQLMHSTSKKAKENRQQEVAEVSSGIKALSKELNVPIVVLAQLNRDIEKEKNRKPRMSDLRESGSIEQDADLVAFLYRPDVNDDELKASENDGCAVTLVIGKQRNGPTGDVDLTFLKPFTRFEQASKFSAEDVPAR
ncbi:MAG TPA: replicative DNA helicase [Candidatus Sulfotelmatobacter sp.]|jgi:replicative DNA helicase|nr:replicative DNA helicase [Candidatus Sulfotelmatobacter sp.]